MTTVEKLFVQIFESKNRIIEQVKQQTDLYSQHLASKLLIDGITPPPWLWNPNFVSESSDPKELKKEELISELLLPHPRPEVPYSGSHYSLYNKSAALGDNGELSGLFVETHAFDKGFHAGDRPTTSLKCHDNDIGCAFPVLVISAPSPQGQTDTRISNIYTDTGSNVGDRSTTVLEHHENDIDSALECVPELELGDTSPKGQTEARISNIYTAPDQSLARIQRSKSRQKALELRKTATVAAAARSRLTDENAAGVCSSGIKTLTIASQHLDHDIGLFGLAKYFATVDDDGPVKHALGDCHSKEKNSNTYSGRITRSRSSCNLSSHESRHMELGNSSDIGKEDGCRMIRSESTCTEGLSKPVSLTYTADQRVTRSKSGVSKKFPLDNLLNRSEGFHLQNVSGGEVIRHCPDSNAIVNHERKPHYITQTELFSDGLVESQGACSESNLDTDGPSVGSVRVSYTASQRVTRSKSGASKNYPLDNLLNRSEGFPLQNVSGSEAIVIQEGKTNHITETELISDGLVEAQAACSQSNLDAGGLSVGFEAFVLRPPSDCGMLVKPKTLDVDEMENFSLLGKERLDKSSVEKCSSMKSTTSQDKISFHMPSRKSLEKQSLEQEVSNQKTDAWRGSFETCVRDFVVDNQEVSKSKMDENIENSEDMTESVQEIQPSPASNGIDIELSSVDKSLDVERHQKVKCHLMEGFESSPIPQVEECVLNHDGRDKSEATPFSFKHRQFGPSFVSSLTELSTVDQGCLVGEVRVIDPSSSVLDAKKCCVEDNQDLMCLENKTLLEKKSDMGEDCFLARGSVGSLHHEINSFGSSKIVELPHIEKSLLPGIRLGLATENSWPQVKWRKIEGQQTNSFSASPSFRMKKVPGIGFGNNLGTDIQFHSIPVSYEGDATQSNGGKGDDIGKHLKVKYRLTRGAEPSPELLLEQDELGIEEINSSPNIFSTFKHGQLGPHVLSTLTKGAAGDIQDCSVKDAETADTADTASIVLDVRMQGEEQNDKSMLHSENNVAMENKDDLIRTKSILQETESHLEEDDLFSVASLQDKHLNYIAADQTMPEFEEFIIGTEENGQPHIVGDAFSVDNFDLTSTTIERASILEKLCRSASMHTPLSQFPTTFKLHRAPDLYQSVPNGLLEHMDLRSTLNLSDGSKQLRASYSYVEESIRAIQGLSYSGCAPYSDPNSELSFKKPPMSPVRKLWDQISLNSSSSEKQRSLNPELTCFPIEEDPTISEENENRDEVAYTIQEDICSTLMNCGAKREPLAEITEPHINPPTVSAAERFPDRSSLGSVNTEANFTGTSSKVKRKLQSRNSNKRRCTNEGKENHTLSISTNYNKKDSKLLNNRFSKPKLSGKPSLRRGGQGLPERVPKRNNIVSNITSFVPLVQQKQADAVGAGKRDIKVKALEAAEAAKRLEEKRANERKMKKEALKLERARIEQENMRQMELKMKKEEEEQKKKDGDMAARKRLREQEQQKEKERKRKRIGEVRRHQIEQEEKLHIGKVDKEVPLSAINKKVNCGMESDDGLRKHQKTENKRGYGNIVEKLQTEPVAEAAEILTSDIRQAVLKDCEAFGCCGDPGEPTSVSTKATENDDLASREKSYEISPYQCSDDEDDEEDEIPTRKYIPPWASKNALALVLSSQQNVDPDKIFAPESFCSVDEVLQPRKLQQN
ncbi:Leucine-rich repeat flightless-interacting protein like [Actinidia chinensis var. chinensis]|uniref:Leucine-rich repeat flightless-interacting protein like n=1 Tax=Actinidia chinensis var. chinensis TaxID=1590841 RepID=A0A2R6P545_ACTCC|nr:Leucine-rich repeat flightless-interacting protein like [Actinidia chinensis var. chinensis]